MVRDAEGWQITPSTGGLVTALSALKEQRVFVWLGWPGAEVSPEDQPLVAKQLDAKGACAVFIEKQDLEGFYEGFSNDTLWPLFHDLTERVNFDPKNWQHYQNVNQLYADTIAAQAEPGDTIWIHDYQLSLVPQMLRAKGLACRIGFFLHIPFPTSTAYRKLPVAQEVLRGMLGADLLGFHSYEYVANLRTAALRVLGLESEVEAIALPSHSAHLLVAPIGIEPSEVMELVNSPEATQETQRLLDAYPGKKLIAGVDRLDYTKGIPQKLLGFETLLRKYPEHRGEVVLVQVAAPSRTGVEEYQQLKHQVDELMGRIVGEFSSVSYTPVVYVNQPLDRANLAGLYRAAEIGLVTPIRDGMNLVALEYVAARHGLGGTLILSEFCGAAQCLPGAKLINPFNPEQLADALHEALIDPSSQPHAFMHMEEFVRRNTSGAWARLFLETLEQLTGPVSPRFKVLDVHEPGLRDLVAGSSRPLVALDYDGTLRSYVVNPEDAVPNQRILEVLDGLSRFADVYVISGRDGATLEKWFGQLAIGLVCEHGIALKTPGEQWRELVKVNHGTLKNLVGPVFEEFVRRTPGSSIEAKTASLAWHYRGADPEYAQFQKRELQIQLEDLLKRRPYHVLKGNAVIEVRHKGVSKGHAMRHILALHSASDFVFCAGDDRTDEEMLRAIPNHLVPFSIRCWVGGVNHSAEYWQRSNDKLLDELEKLVALLGQRPSGVFSEPDSQTRRSTPAARSADPLDHNSHDAPEAEGKTWRAAHAR